MAVQYKSLSCGESNYIGQITGIPLRKNNASLLLVIESQENEDAWRCEARMLCICN